MLPYSRQSIDDRDIEAVVRVLRSDWLTTGPSVEAFEEAFARATGARYAVAVNSGTAALHAALHVFDLGPGDEVLVPPITFAASANAVVYHGASPIFCDVEPSTLLIDMENLEEKITPRTRGIVAVDYAGQPCDYDRLRQIAAKHGLFLLADACHSLGGSYKGRPVGSLAELNAFSFHPVKPLTTGEGGMVTTSDSQVARRLKQFRNHGIDRDHHQRAEIRSWSYEMIELGHNYRLTDFQAALGLAQLRNLAEWTARRNRIANDYYQVPLSKLGLTPLQRHADRYHAYHLFVVRIDPVCGIERDRLFNALRAEGIGVQVHYRPVHLHPFYVNRFGTGPGECPVAEEAYQNILSLPIFPSMTEVDFSNVISAITRVLEGERS